jgi:hypothetical protein
MGLALTFLEQYHKNGNEFISYTVQISGDKAWFHFLMAKPKSSKSSGCTHSHHISQRSVNEHFLPARKLVATVLWNRRGVPR